MMNRSRSPSVTGSTDDAESIASLDFSSLGPYDVVAGRHKEAFNNVGNRRFRVTVAMSLDRYMEATKKHDKTIIIMEILGVVRSSGGRFLKRSKGEWVELDDKQAREKIGHALRDMATARDPSTSVGRRSSTDILGLTDNSGNELQLHPHLWNRNGDTVPVVSAPTSNDRLQALDEVSVVGSGQGIPKRLLSIMDPMDTMLAGGKANVQEEDTKGRLFMTFFRNRFDMYSELVSVDGLSASATV